MASIMLNSTERGGRRYRGEFGAWNFRGRRNPEAVLSVAHAYRYHGRPVDLRSTQYTRYVRPFVLKYSNAL